jgi:P4 family phage/plasmid primase-like protien
MAVSLADRFETYRSNMSPGMYSLLSQQLSVSRNSLELLGVGFYPAKNAWVFPERDAAGEIIGLVLRSPTGFKFMVGGSKRGLTYVLNPDYEKGDRRYDCGKHRWIRAYETDYVCPLCGKNDWCLLSRDNPADPPAVICGRVEQGAFKRLSGDSGYLHILHNSGNMGGVGPALAKSDGPTVVIEGQTDTLAALDLGFQAVGRPNNVAGQSMLKDLIGGRETIIVGENDAPDKYGKCPGIEGMEATFETLYNAGGPTTRVLPPEGCKDLRAWTQRLEPTAKEFLAYVEKYGDRRRNVDILPDDNGLTVVKHWIASCRTIDGLPTIRCYKDKWVQFKDHRYELAPKSMIRGEIWNYLDGRYYFKDVKGVDEPTIFRPSMNKISDVIDAMYSFGPILDDPPLWLEGGQDMPDPVNLIQFTNGILNVDEYLKGNVVLYNPTPKLFSFTSVPHEFNPDASSEYWENYINEIFNGDVDRVRLLQQWFGYNLVPDVSLEKMMFFIGRPCSGKSTIIGALNDMLGDDNVCCKELDSLAGRFGYEPLIGKLAVLLGDAQSPRPDLCGRALEKILHITGGDAVGIERKGVTDIPQYRLHCRFTVAMNLLPSLPDHATALERRLSLISFPNSYAGREDTSIKQTLRSIASDIIPWALRGLRDLRESGEFIVPETSSVVVRRFKNMASPVHTFVNQYCDLFPQNRAVYAEEGLLYDAWKSWTAGQNMKPGIRPQFMQRLMALNPDLCEDVLDDERGTAIVRGICLKDWVDKEIGD